MTKIESILLAGALLLGTLPAAGAPMRKQCTQPELRYSVTCPNRRQSFALLAKASSLMEGGRYQMVVDLLQPGVILQCQVNADLLLAGAFDALGNLDLEGQTLRRAQTEWPDSSSVGASLASYYMSGGDVHKALAALQHTTVTPSTPLQELQLMTTVYLENNDLDRARKMAQTAYEGYPSEETLLLAANVLQMQGRYMDVIPMLNGVRTKYSASAKFLITLAESEYDAQMYRAALHDVSMGLQIDEGSYAGHYVLANTLVKSGALARARAEYKLAIGLSPSQPRTYYRLALAQEMGQDTSGAEDSLKLALVADNRYAPAYGELGKLLLREKRYHDAISELEKAITYNPHFDEAYYLLVQAYGRLDEKDKSSAALAQWNKMKVQAKAHTVARRTAPPSKEMRQASY